jgi:secreted trypsin-like serine protease
MKRSGLPLTLLCLLVLPGCQGAILDQPQGPGIDENALRNGEVDRGDPGVALLAIYTANSTSVCSGTLVTPRSILTAAHCVHPATVGQITQIRVGFGTFSNQLEELVDVASYTYDPRFNPQNLGAGYDAAIVVLQAPSTRPTVAFNEDPDPVLYGGFVRLVGWGQPQVGTKYTGMALLVEPGEVLYGVAAGASAFFAHSCGGDSGGPMLARDYRGVEKIIGVSSFGNGDCLGRTTAYYYGVARSIDFIRANLR